MLLVLGLRAEGADPTFVGSLALALDESVAEELNLSEATREELEDLVARRENQALELAISLKGASASEKEEKLAQYVEESEQLGYALLTEPQRQILRQLQIRRQGLKSILDQDVAKQLNLADWQQEQIDALRQELQRQGRDDGTLNRTFERQVGQILSTSQRIKWEEMAGLTAPNPGIPDDQVVPPAAPGDASPSNATAEQDKVAENSPAASQGMSPSDQLPEVISAQEVTPHTGPAPAGENTLRFSFRYQPWGDVLDWFAEQADLSLVMDAPPPGTFNYTDGREYTPAQAIDILNSVLLTKGYTLVRREKMLIVINLEDGIPPNLVTTVSAEELDNRGDYELVSVLFDLDKLPAEQAEAEINKLIGPQGAVVALTQSQQVFVTETAGRLRTIRDMIEAVENPLGSDVTVVAPQNGLADEVLTVVRQLMGMAEGENTSQDGSVRFATDSLSSKIFITGKKDAVEKVKRLIQQVDVPGGMLGGGSPADQLQLEVYPLGTLDPTVTLQVMQTLLAGNPDVRLATDESTGNLIVLARGQEHATVRATLAQMQRDSKQVEVIHLATIDPQVAVLSISKLFRGSGEGANPNAPIVDADPITSQLLVRGTADQVRQIKDLLQKMGEDPDAAAAARAERGNIRSIPLTGGAAEQVLRELETLWPSVSASRIRVVRPSSRPGIRNFPTRREQDSPALTEPPAIPPSSTPASTYRDASDSEAQWKHPSTNQAHWVNFQDEEDAESDDSAARPTQPQQPAGRPSPLAPTITAAQAPVQATEDNSSSPSTPGDIVVMMGPSGLVIASDDQEALNQLEALIETLSARYASTSQYSVYYLRYVKADVAAQLLQSILTGSTPSSDSGGGSLLGDIASDMLGGGGGLMGSLMGLGSGGSSTSLSGGSLSIVPDLRLNALVVQASLEDLEKIDQLLEIMDQPHSPEEVETKRQPRMIPVLYTSAQDIASIVQQVYSDRMLSNNPQQQRQPSPEDFIRALRGGRGGRDGGGGQANSEPEKMTIGVDTRSNSLVVSAPDPLFEEVRSLVEQLDQAGDETNHTMQAVRVRSSSPETIQRALSTLTGQSVTVGSASTASSNNNQASSSSNPGTAQSGPDPDEIRRRMEFFNRIRSQMQEGGGGGGEARGGENRGSRGGFSGGGNGRGSRGGGRGGR